MKQSSSFMFCWVIIDWLSYKCLSCELSVDRKPQDIRRTWGHKESKFVIAMPYSIDMVWIKINVGSKEPKPHTRSSQLISRHYIELTGPKFQNGGQWKLQCLHSRFPIFRLDSRHLEFKEHALTRNVPYWIWHAPQRGCSKMSSISHRERKEQLFPIL